VEQRESTNTEKIEREELKVEREIPADSEVFSKRKRVEILRTNGKLEFGELVVKIW